jgi:hypothetical protein
MRYSAVKAVRSNERVIDLPELKVEPAQVLSNH